MAHAPCDVFSDYIDLTIVSPRNYFLYRSRLFTASQAPHVCPILQIRLENRRRSMPLLLARSPLLPAAATGTVEERSIVEPVRKMLGKKARLCLAAGYSSLWLDPTEEATSCDPQAQTC